MNKEIGKLEWDCQIITKDGKYFGYGDNEDIHEREWHDDPVKAIVWNLKLDDPSKVASPTPMGLNEAKLIKVKKTIIIESYE
jgi:hypothetical protein